MLFAFRLWIVSVGLPGLLHSLLALAPVCAAVLAGEYWLRGEWEWAAVGVALIGSHLVLNPVDGGPVLLLFPLVETGIGLQYPARTVFGQGLVGGALKGPLVTLRATVLTQGFNTYGFIEGAGVAPMLLFAVVSLLDRRRGSTPRTPGESGMYPKGKRPDMYADQFAPACETAARQKPPWDDLSVQLSGRVFLFHIKN